MFEIPAKPYRKQLDSGLVLRALETEEDIDRLAEFNQMIHHDEEGIRDFTVRLIRDHPFTRAEYWLTVTDPASGEIVSTLSLIPWSLEFGGARFRSAEMGIVGTREGYRGRGLIRALNDRFSELMIEDGFPMSHIQGIPYFYRQFGYEYAVPLEVHYVVELRDISTHEPRYRIRTAKPADIPELGRFYDRSVETWEFRIHRPAEIWSYILGPSLETCVAADTYVVENAGGTGETVENDKNAPVGYFRISREGFGKGLILQECSELPRDAYPAVFAFLRRTAEEKKKPYLRLNMPEFSGAVRHAMDIGGRGDGGYRWQIKIPDPAGFLTTVKTGLNVRLRTSEYADYSGSLTIGMYRSALRLDIEAGVVTGIEPLPGSAEAGVRFPPNLAPPLLLGDRTLEECREFYPDVGFDRFAGRLFAVLFSHRSGFLYENY